MGHRTSLHALMIIGFFGISSGPIPHADSRPFLDSVCLKNDFFQISHAKKM
jgi:hypothetical protein